MGKFIYIFAILTFIANANAQEEDISEGVIDYGYKKQILQTSDPFLNNFYNIEEAKYEVGSEITDTEKEKITLKESGYEFKESDYIKAIETGDKIAVLRFLSLGMPIVSMNTYDNATVFYALRAKQYEMFDLLMSKGATVNYINSRSQNLLLQAIELDYDYMIPHLVEADINLKFVDHNGWSAMHYAIENKDVKTVFLLLEKTPELLSYKNKFGNTPLLLALDSALKKKDKELIALSKILLRKEKYLNITNAVGNTAIHFATMLNNYQLSKYILELGANPNIKNAKGWRPIDIALKNENVDMANLLRFYGAEL